MKKEGKIMKCLEIKNGKGFFRNKNEDMLPLDQIKKDDLMFLLDIATSADEEFEMDDMNKNSIENQAHKIIYGDLYDKFSELLNNKRRFLDESENMYKNALQKYQD